MIVILHYHIQRNLEQKTVAQVCKCCVTTQKFLPIFVPSQELFLKFKDKANLLVKPENQNQSAIAFCSNARNVLNRPQALSYKIAYLWKLQDPIFLKHLIWSQHIKILL